MSKRPGDPGYAPNWCIHFRNASKYETCEIGINYEAWRGLGHDKRPCFLTEDGHSKAEAAHCPQLRRPTPDEIAAHKVWLESRMTLLGVVMIGIGDWRAAHKGKSAAEIVECPACKGRLHLSIAAHNGHVHGRCETQGCVSWME